MDRKEFLRSSCKLGLCACTGMLFTGGSRAESETAGTPECSPNKDEWKLEFMQKRFARFIEVIDADAGEETKDRIIEQLGRYCAQTNRELTEKYVGNIDGFLEHIQNQWVDKAVYDKEKNEISVYDKPREECFCPFVDSKIMSKEFCNCSKGWQKQTYETILGRKVDVEIISSILRGGDRCAFKIKVLA